MTQLGVIFSTLSLVVLANGVILSVVSREFQGGLRRASYYWQAGTFLFSAGYATFAFGDATPQPVIIILTNLLVLSGLTAYCAAIRSFYGQRQLVSMLLPCLLAMGVISTSVFVSLDSFKLRLVAFSSAFLWLILGGIGTLWSQSRQTKSISPLLLIGIFAIVAIFTFVRLVVFLGMPIQPDFSLLAGGNWLNVATPFFMPMFLVIGTTAFLLMFSDDLRRQLEISASTDPLTGLPNRRSFASLGEAWLAKAMRRTFSFAIAIVDVDHFKTINDSYGHGVGDLALEHVAANLRKQVRPVDVVARIGGEEFAALINCANLAEARDIMDRLRLAIEKSEFKTGNVKIPITLSVGVAIFHPGDKKLDDLLRAADVALYAAKTAGRNRVECMAGRPQFPEVLAS